MDEELKGFDAIIRACQIFKQYSNPDYPTHCEHDELMVFVDPSVVSKEDIDELEGLGFSANREEEYFFSYRFGSC
jgi:hypothetical protein